MTMESMESALELLLAHAAPVCETEELALDEALGRVAAQDVASPIAVPPFDRSPLDGYALHSEDIAQASRENPAVLRVVGEACAGCGTVFSVARGEALRIMTGAPVPEGCDCVIRQEDTDEGMERVQMYASVGHMKNICFAGEDVPLGAVMLHAGEEISCAHIGVLSSLGVTRVRVYRRVRVALLSTGDELVQPGQALTYGKIYDANRAALTAHLRMLDTQAIILDSEADEPQAVAEALMRAAQEADLLITTGGVSVGKKDIMHRVLPLMGAQRLFWRVAMKPGTPLLCGLYGEKPVICLSGNPFAAMACFEVFATPVIRRMAGRSRWENPRVKTTVSGGFDKPSKGRRLLRARFDGQRACLVGSNHSSGSLSSVIGCNCLIDVPAGSGPLCDGDPVEIILL